MARGFVLGEDQGTEMQLWHLPLQGGEQRQLDVSWWPGSRIIEAVSGKCGRMAVHR